MIHYLFYFLFCFLSYHHLSSGHENIAPLIESLTNDVARLEKEFKKNINNIEKLKSKIESIKDSNEKKFSDIDVQIAEILKSVEELKKKEKKIDKDKKIEKKDYKKELKKSIGFYEEGKYKDARPLFQTLLKSSSQPQDRHIVLFYLGGIDYVEGQYKEAAVRFVEAYKSAPQGEKAQDTLLKLALSLKKSGKKQEACRTLLSLQDAFKDLKKSVSSDVKFLKEKWKCS